MVVNLSESIAIARTKAAIEEVRKAGMLARLLDGNYTDAQYGSEPMAALADAAYMLGQAQKTLEYALAVIEGRT